MIVLFLGFIVSIATMDFWQDRVLSAILPVVLSIFIIIDLMMIMKIYKMNGKPEKQYEVKVKALEDAEKELKKFLIDHPEFEEIKK